MMLGFASVLEAEIKALQAEEKSLREISKHWPKIEQE
jgi:hypothetical protein